MPTVGSGTYEDPRRPMFAPSDADRQRTRREEQIIGYSYQLSDDGQVALVEFVARDRKAFEAIAGSGLSDVRTFSSLLRTVSVLLHGQPGIHRYGPVVGRDRGSLSPFTTPRIPSLIKVALKLISAPDSCPRAGDKSKAEQQTVRADGVRRPTRPHRLTRAKPGPRTVWAR